MIVIDYWKCTLEELPNESETVIVLRGNEWLECTFHIGISKDTREKMKSGELEDPLFFPDIDLKTRRSDVTMFRDEFAGNKKPYCFIHNDTTRIFNGQDISFWRHIGDKKKLFMFKYDHYSDGTIVGIVSGEDSESAKLSVHKYFWLNRHTDIDLEDIEIEDVDTENNCTALCKVDYIYEDEYKK